MVMAQEPRLYAKFGFKPLAEPQIHMEILNPDIYEETVPYVA
jgi:hypothetical protein